MELAISVLLGICCNLSYSYLKYGGFTPSVFMVIGSLILAALFYFCFFISKKFLSHKNYIKISKIVELIFNKNYNNKKQLIIIFAIIFLCWLPYLLLMYPGNLSNDTTGQISMFFSRIQNDGIYPMTDHHPIFTSFVFGGIIYVFNLMTNNMHCAIFALCLIQLTITAAVFAYMFFVCYSRWKCPKWFCYILLFCIALIPIFPIIVSSVSKDTFFSWIYILFLVTFIDLIFSNFKKLNSPKIFINLIAFSILLCLTKKIGVYLVIPTFFITALFCNQKIYTKIKILLPGILCAFIMFLIMPQFLSFASITAGSQAEMLSIPFQQTARTFLYHQNELPENEKQIIDEFLNTDTLADRYNPIFADSVKNEAIVDNGLSPYIKVWITEGLRYPKTYISAWIHHISPLFQFDSVTPIFNSLHHDWVRGYFVDSVFEKNDFFTNNSKSIQEFYKWFCTMPIFNIVLSGFIYVIFIPSLFLVILLTRKNKRSLLCFIPVALSFMALLVSPIVQYSSFETMRYIIPFIYTAPLLLMASQKCHKTEQSVLKKRNKGV